MIQRRIEMTVAYSFNFLYYVKFNETNLFLICCNMNIIQSTAPRIGLQVEYSSIAIHLIFCLNHFRIALHNITTSLLLETSGCYERMKSGYLFQNLPFNNILDWLGMLFISLGRHLKSARRIGEASSYVVSCIRKINMDRQ